MLPDGWQKAKSAMTAKSKQTAQNKYARWLLWAAIGWL